MVLGFPLRRFFLALPLEGEAKDHFRQVQGRLEEFSDLFRFQNPDSPHLTLHFFGDVGELEYQGILKQVGAIASRTEAFTCVVQEAGTFGKPGSERVLFLELAYNAELARLAKQCPWPRDKPFAAHLTLARMKNPHEFTVHKKKIMKLLKDVQFPITRAPGSLHREVEEEWCQTLRGKSLELPVRGFAAPLSAGASGDAASVSWRSFTFDRLRLYAEIEGKKQMPIGDFPFALPEVEPRGDEARPQQA